MAGRGPAPQPIEVKRRRGNPGKRSLPNPVTTIAPITVITRPQDEPADGTELIAALLAAGAAAWIGTTDQLATLTLLRDGWDTRAHLRRVLTDEGWSYMASSEQGGERWYPRPEAAQLRDLEKQITVWLSQLGLNPADRGRLGLAQVKAQSKLEGMRERRARLVSAAGRPAG